MKTVKLIVVGMLMSISVCAQDANNKAGKVDWVARFEAMVDTMNAKVSTATSDQWVHYKKQYNLLVAEANAGARPCAASSQSISR